MSIEDEISQIKLITDDTEMEIKFRSSYIPTGNIETYHIEYEGMGISRYDGGPYNMTVEISDNGKIYTVIIPESKISSENKESKFSVSYKGTAEVKDYRGM